MDRIVTLDRLYPTAVHTTRYTIRSWERERRPDSIPHGDHELVPYVQLGDTIVIEKDDQLEALVRYAREVKQLLTVQDTKRRQYVMLSEDMDFDVDLHRLDAWEAAAPHLRALREADRAYERARRRLVQPVYEALQVGVPGPALAAEAGRTRQWIQQTADHLKDRHLLNTKIAFDRLATRRPQWAAGLMVPEVLPLTGITEVMLGKTVDRILQSLQETEWFTRGTTRTALPHVSPPETTVTVDDDLRVKAVFEVGCDYLHRELAEAHAAPWAARSSDNLADVIDYLAPHGGGLACNVLPGAVPSWPRRRITLHLDSVGLSQPRRRGRPPKHTRGTRTT